MFEEDRSNTIEINESSDESIEEITEQDYNSGFWMSGGGRRDRDMLKYPGSSNYGSGLSNFAWAQAVQNKPFSESLCMQAFQLTKEETKTKTKEVLDVASDESSEKVGSSSGKNDELEEGEISMEGGDSSAQNDEELEKRIESIRETLENLAVNDTKYSDGVCLRLQTSLDDLQSIVSERKGVSELGALLDQAFARIQAVISVFNSLESKLKEQDKDEISRLLAHVKGQDPTIFSVEQMKEIQAAMDSLSPSSVSSRVNNMQADKNSQMSTDVKNEVGTLGGKSGLVATSLQDRPERVLVKPADQNNSMMGSENLRQGVLSDSRGRGSFGPLLDLHVDHDVDSLPSPTRESPLPPYRRDRHVLDDGKMKSESMTKVATKNADVPLQSYETDALKAVSSYQQKFRQSSFNLSSRLPSPTPSENSDDGDGDSTGEVSSSFTVGNVRSANTSMPLEVVGSVAPNMNYCNGQTGMPGKMIGQVTSAPSSNFRPSSKSRDPRLRLLNHDVCPSDTNLQPQLRDTSKIEPFGIVNLKKNKNAGDTFMESKTCKKQRNDSAIFEVPRDVEMARIVGGLDSCSSVGTTATDRIQSAMNMKTDSRKSENGSIFSDQQYEKNGIFNASISRPDQLPAIGTSTTASLPSLLKDIAVNPTMLVQFLLEQQRLASESHKSNNLSQDTPLTFSSPGINPSTNVPPSQTCDNDTNFAEKPELPSQLPSMIPQADLGVRMKPRDPRRILHSNPFQRIENLGPDQSKMIRAPTSTSQGSREILSVKQQNQQTQANCFPTKSTSPPDIASQFTKNLRNVADILSSKPIDSISTVAQIGGSSQPIAVKAEITNGRGILKSSTDRYNGKTLPESISGTSRLQSDAWEDVEHLFEGYDDKQKAAIQRERSRRLGEQNQMFASKKLCLVLDLDHTLLNSAKFVEVEPVHEEILRKKEELDREKPRRHLFRLSHMGMWTKLRPGIWTFLEKASKLYELHLYTMGNKVYATEMAKLLDPTGVLFAGRVISKGDDGDPFDSDEKLPKCKDLEGVLGMESSVVIIDDSVKVWPHNKLNLILVERYTYFPCSRQQFGLPGPSLLEIDHDERPEDGTLASSSMVIEKLHKNFFSNPLLHEADIRNILASEQRKILAGCRILFSRIFPVGEAKPHQHPLWQTAEQFGAVCTTQIDNMVTHVVANSLGTDKVNWALSTGRFVVHPGWVEASALLYRRANEKEFAVKMNLP